MLIISDLRIFPVTSKLFQRRRLLEFSFIIGPVPVGPTMGIYREQEFAEFVRDSFGRMFVFSGVASRRSDGRLIADNLRRGEFFALPGLIYCLIEYANKNEPCRRLPDEEIVVGRLGFP